MVGEKNNIAATLELQNQQKYDPGLNSKKNLPLHFCCLLPFKKMADKNMFMMSYRKRIILSLSDELNASFCNMCHVSTFCIQSRKIEFYIQPQKT